MRGAWSSSGLLCLPHHCLCSMCPEAGPASASLAAPEVGALGKQLSLTWASGWRCSCCFSHCLKLLCGSKAWELQIPEPPWEEVPGSWDNRELGGNSPCQGCLGCDWGQALSVLDGSQLALQRIHSYSHLQMGLLTTGSGFGTCRVGCWTLGCAGLPTQTIPMSPNILVVKQFPVLYPVFSLTSEVVLFGELSDSTGSRVSCLVRN